MAHLRRDLVDLRLIGAVERQQSPEWSIALANNSD